MKKRVMVLTGGGDCPGLNAVIRAIVKRANKERDWEVVGSIEAFNGVLNEPMELVVLDNQAVSGIHVQGGTILKTTNKGGPFAWPIKNADGSWGAVDRSEELLRRLQYQHIEAVINIGGDGSQRISQTLFEMGMNVIGVPKTIDNDLAATDFTFGFQTAVDVATDALDKLVTTAASHNRVIILEVMGRDAGWIALSSAIASGAEICLIPEIPYDIDAIMKSLQQRIRYGKGFAVIVVAEGAKPRGGEVSTVEVKEVGYAMTKLGGAGAMLVKLLKDNNFEGDIRTTILGHLQRGGQPNAFDRLLATQFGVKAFELVLEQRWGHMVAYKHPDIIAVPIVDAIRRYKVIDVNSDIVNTARGIGICLGD